MMACSPVWYAMAISNGDPLVILQTATNHGDYNWERAKVHLRQTFSRYPDITNANAALQTIKQNGQAMELHCPG